MTTNFLSKKGVFAFVLVLTMGITLGSFVYASRLAAVETVALDTSFYYLVSEDMQMEAGAEFIKLDGGAGYFLENDGEEHVALSVYLKEEDSLTVLKNLENDGKTGKVISVEAQKLYLKSAKDKKLAARYQGAFQSMYGCMQVLEECVFRLEKGMTQESCKRLLNTLKNQFSYLEKQYQREFESCASVCKAAEVFLTEILADTVYVKDLRYLACQLADDYVALANEFSL